MRFSDRVGRISESATMAVTAEAARLRRAGVDVVALGAGEPDFPTPENIKQAAVRAIESNFTRYTAAGGIPELREAIVAWHARELGTDYGPSECIATVGGKHAIFNFLAAVVDRGAEVILPVPYWVTFYDVINYYGGTPVKVRTQESNAFSLTADDIEGAITDRTRVVIVNSPNNPSGAVVERGEYERILRLTSGKGVTLLSDECYSHFTYSSDPFSIAASEGAKQNVAVAGSLSKTFAMTGWRLGYLLGPADLISNANKLQSHATSNPNSIAQKAALEALEGNMDAVYAMLEQYRARREYVVAALNDIPGVTCPQPNGAFYAYPNISSTFGRGGIHSGMDFAKRLLGEAHVALVPGEAFGTTEHVRLSYAASMQDLEEGVRRIRAFIDGLT
ncbi:MAG: pyridoxal phosphate-dependent aminotransferase [Bryobacterales bacterium]|nr:pyridoxal phosphate-dependent aminotransferase [Bryobacterales bacterium]